MTVVRGEPSGERRCGVRSPILQWNDERPYDWVDNLGRRSPRVLYDLPDPRPGDPLSRAGGRFDVGRVRSIVPGEQLTASVMGALMSYVLVPAGPSTRLLLKVVTAERNLAALALGLGDLGAQAAAHPRPPRRDRWHRLRTDTVSPPPGPALRRVSMSDAKPAHPSCNRAGWRSAIHSRAAFRLTIALWTCAAIRCAEPRRRGNRGDAGARHLHSPAEGWALVDKITTACHRLRKCPVSFGYWDRCHGREVVLP
jgi:hypothetical protein